MIWLLFCTVTRIRLLAVTLASLEYPGSTDTPRVETLPSAKKTFFNTFTSSESWPSTSERVSTVSCTTGKDRGASVLTMTVMNAELTPPKEFSIV